MINACSPFDVLHGHGIEFSLTCTAGKLHRSHPALGVSWDRASSYKAYIDLSIAFSVVQLAGGLTTLSKGSPSRSRRMLSLITLQR